MGLRVRKRTRQSFFTNKRYKASNRLAIFGVTCLILVLLLGKGVNSFASLFKPFSQDVLVKKQYTWDSKTELNVAIRYNGVSVLSYDPGQNSIVILNIPDDTYLDLPKGFGYWKVGSIYSLGQEEKQPVGEELLKQSLSRLVGLPIDGFIAIDNQPKDRTLTQIITSWHSNPLSNLLFIKDIKTDFTPLETVSILRSLASVRADKVTTLDLGVSNITQSQLLPDQSRVLGVDSVRLDTFIRNQMADSTILSEDTPVAIFNATSHSGLAQDAAREVTNMGGNVIFVTNTENYLDQSIVLSGNQSTTLKRLTQIFAPSCLKKKCGTSDFKVTSSRAEINVVLGEDFYKDKYERN